MRGRAKRGASRRSGGQDEATGRAYPTAGWEPRGRRAARGNQPAQRGGRRGRTTLVWERERRPSRPPISPGRSGRRRRPGDGRPTRARAGRTRRARVERPNNGRGQPTAEKGRADTPGATGGHGRGRAAAPGRGHTKARHRHARRTAARASGGRARRREAHRVRQQPRRRRRICDGWGSREPARTTQAAGTGETARYKGRAERRPGQEKRRRGTQQAGTREQEKQRWRATAAGAASQNGSSAACGNRTPGRGRQPDGVRAHSEGGGPQRRDRRTASGETVAPGAETGGKGNRTARAGRAEMGRTAQRPRAQAKAEAAGQPSGTACVWLCVCVRGAPDNRGQGGVVCVCV